jgi:hypothetical protein
MVLIDYNLDADQPECNKDFLALQQIDLQIISIFIDILNATLQVYSLYPFEISQSLINDPGLNEVLWLNEQYP